MPKLYMPLPVIAGVTSNSTISFTRTAPFVLNGAPAMRGELFQFSAVSVHGVDVPLKSFDTA